MNFMLTLCLFPFFSLAGFNESQEMSFKESPTTNIHNRRIPSR